jgi:pSer/pThr/pTyr-binding forkhead associated (FHA) protein
MPLVLNVGGERHVVGAGLTVGAHPDCAPCVTHPSVAPLHATVRAERGRVLVEDLGSAGGTFVGDERLEPHRPRWVRVGDALRFGEVTARVEDEITAPAAETRRLALQMLGREAVRVGPTVLVVEGPSLGTALELPEGASRVGRREPAELVLKDEAVSKEHAVLVRRGAQVVVRDAGSTHGTFLGGARLEPGRDALWVPGVPLRMGDSVLVLEPGGEIASLRAWAVGTAQDASMTPRAEADAEGAVPEPAAAAPQARALAPREPAGGAPIAPVAMAAPKPVGPGARAVPAWPKVVLTLLLLGSVAVLVWLLAGGGR